MRDLWEQVLRAAKSDAKILVTGETGVGKEFIAKAMHDNSQRRSGPYLAVNCAGITESILESELFGYVRGSFTGAVGDKPGLLEQAHLGTFLLDEVGEMSGRMQALLLRFLELGELQKVGARTRYNPKVNVRVVASTNEELSDKVADGKFREDLFYRLRVVELRVPPLREHIDDLTYLVDHFLSQIRNGSNGDVVVESISPEAIQVMMSYPWPGNVRELQNAVATIATYGRKKEIRAEDIPPTIFLPDRISLRKLRQKGDALADRLFKIMRSSEETFWTIVYEPFMDRDLTRDDVRRVVSRGLEETNGNYRLVASLFNLPPTDYKRFLSCLRKHECQVDFKLYRKYAPGST